ncbi:nitroreductase family protein [Eubacteriaceae bacterium ES2]|nr:nitroreductase family protein [Eubacteriaceae bacterium ES2]
MITINEEKCIGCQLCLKDCPRTAIKMTDANKAQVLNQICFDCGHCIAICPQEAVSSDSPEMKEVKNYEAESFQLPSQNLLNFIKFRRSVRRFKDQPVEQADLETIIEAGRYTETGSNTQDVSYIVVTETLEEVADVIYDLLRKKGKAILENKMEGMERYHLYAKLWVKMYDDYHADKIGQDRLFFHAPTIIFVTARNPVNGALASANMELMTKALGLGCCFCGFALAALNDQPEILKDLGVEEDCSLVSCMIIGHPAVTYKRTVPRNKATITWK